MNAFKTSLHEHFGPQATPKGPKRSKIVEKNLHDINKLESESLYFFFGTSAFASEMGNFDAFFFIQLFSLLLFNAFSSFF